ncbi:hypothetical protein AB0H73_09665 [Streptomyces olivoreticuli]
MSGMTSGAGHPLTGRLRQIAAAEQDRRTAAAQAVADAERILARALEAQRAADMRADAVLALLETAEGYISSLVHHAPPRTTPGTGARPAAASGRRTIGALVLAALQSGDDVPLGEIVEQVQKSRPSTTANSVRTALTNLCRGGAVERTGQSVYRIAAKPEEGRTGT